MISFQKNFTAITYDENKTLMANLQLHKIPIASSCGGKGICHKCLINVNKGNENLSPPNIREVNFKNQHSLPDSVRVSCQTYVKGAVTINTSYW